MSESYLQGKEKVGSEIRNKLAVIKGQICISKEYVSIKGIDVDYYLDCMVAIDKAIEEINVISKLPELDKIPNKEVK